MFSIFKKFKKKEPIVFVGSRWGMDFLTENCELLNIKIIGFLDRMYEPGHIIKGVECIGSEKELLDNPHKFGNAMFFLGNSWDGNSRIEDKPEESGYHLRLERLALIKKLNLPCHTLIHPDTKISKGATFGQGSYTGRWVDVRDDVQFGEHVTALDYAAFGHDAVMGENSFVSVKGFVAGGVKCGKNVFVGCNATIVTGRFGGHLEVGDDCKIHGHAYVTKDMEPGTQALFNGRILKRVDLDLDKDNHVSEDKERNNNE